jgi:hypothetical protein
MIENKPVKITVLLKPGEFSRFDAYCEEMGYKKSPLIARLIREYLNHEGFKRNTLNDDTNENSK